MYLLLLQILNDCIHTFMRTAQMLILCEQIEFNLNVDAIARNTQDK